MKLTPILLSLGLLLFTIPGISQTQVNQTDAQGQRHGVWKKTYPDSEQLRYEGAFKHGKEIGEFKFYCESCKDQPTVIKNFLGKNDIAEVRYFTPKGKLVSEGKMQAKNHIGEWVYYHKNSKEVMTREFYKDGKLDGTKTTFYPNGKVTEEVTYKNGIKEGENNYYSYNGVLIKKLNYKDGKLHGPALHYNAAGDLIIEGGYKNGKQHGVWKHFENGKLISEESFPKKYDK